MIHARRTAFTEQPDGSLTCTITIPAADRLAALGGHPVYLSELPGSAPATSTAKGPDERYVVEMEAADSAYSDKPETQHIQAQGAQPPPIMEVLTVSDWDHPAAPYIMHLYRHPTFQQYAREHVAGANAFSAPMELASRLIMQQGSLGALAALMDHYQQWASARALPLWPKVS